MERLCISFRKVKSSKCIRTLNTILKKTDGYHFGVRWCAISSAAVLLINLVTTIWASSHYGVSNGFGTIQSGDCNKTKTFATWLHFCINVLSTLLLGASNYTMQCLSSPTRNEINKAHSENRTLDIGIPSLKNLRRIAWPRLILWWLVALSSVPLHLLYNSAVFSTLATRDFSIYEVTGDFINGAPFDLPPYVNNASEITNLRLLQNSSSTWRKVESRNCIEKYRRETFTSTHGDILYVHPHEHTENPLINSKMDQREFQVHPKQRRELTPRMFLPCNVSAYCNTTQTPNFLYDTTYCLEQPITQHCRLQFSVAIMIVVIVSNLIKMICMGLIAWQRPTQPLVTMGDAIASFLNEPDVTTAGNCLADKKSFGKRDGWGVTYRRWERSRSLLWFHAASKWRWYTCNIV